MFAVIAARSHKQEADKWKRIATDIEAGNVEGRTLSAEAASSQAKLREAKAAEITKKAKARIGKIGERHEDMADLLRRWSG